MNRTNYYNYVEEKLIILATRIESRGKLNVLDIHMHSEMFYLYFFNELFLWNLENLNATKHNVEAIDLIEKNKKILIQVSATATKQKIESSLNKDLSAYESHSFKFISISKNAENLRTKSYKNPYALVFDAKADIFDITSILKTIIALKAPHQKRIFDFIKEELGSGDDVVKVETNLASIVGILGNEDWDDCASGSIQTIPYDVEKKIDFNELVATKSVVRDYSVFHNRLDKIYSEFNKQGKNKSKSVWAAINKEYISHMTSLNGDTLFLKVIERVTQRIQDSANYTQIPYEELELCVNVLVVDAFIRCKIFKEPPTEFGDAVA